jgi:hypothetical protein
MGGKRPADVIGNAVRVMEIATGQREEEYDQAEERKDKAAQPLERGLNGCPTIFVSVLYGADPLALSTGSRARGRSAVDPEGHVDMAESTPWPFGKGGCVPPIWTFGLGVRWVKVADQSAL